MKATLVKLGICECGYTMMEDGVPLGKVYYVDPYNSGPGQMICGGCRKAHSVNLIATLREDGTPDGQHLPEEILNIEYPQDKKATDKKPGLGLRRRAPVRKRAAVARKPSNKKAGKAT